MANEIAVVDLEPWFHRSPMGQQHVVQKVQESCQTIGFFLIKNHSVSSDLIRKMYRVSRDFYDQSESKKTLVGASGSIRGGLTYGPLLAESLAATIDLVTPPDLKETLDFGPEFLGDHWPEENEELHTVWHEYYDALSDLASEIRRIFARAIGLEENYFEPFFENHLSSIRVLNYPSPTQEIIPGQLRAGEHTDYGFLTILRSEDRPGGLQVCRRDGIWLTPPTVENSFIVNIGDTLMRWTNDHWISTPHRVVVPSEEQAANSRRQSMAFFHNPGRETLIECFPSFCAPDKPARYAPIRYLDYATIRYRQSHQKESAEIA